MPQADPYFTAQPLEPGSIPYEDTTAGGRGDIDGTAALGGLAALAGTAAMVKGVHDLAQKDARVGTWDDFATSFGQHFHARPAQGADWDDPLQMVRQRSEIVDMIRDYMPREIFGIPTGAMDDAERRARNEALRWTDERDPKTGKTRKVGVPDPFVRHQGGPRIGDPVAPTMPRLGEPIPGVRGGQKATAADVVGAVAGRTAGDLAGNGLMNLYWAMNATQAVANLGARAALQKYAKLRVHPLAATRNAAGIEANASDKMLDLMAAPTFLAINAGIGNLQRNPGFAMAVPSKDDPTKTDDPLLEAASRMVLNRNGRILPWEQFRQERPDVSQKQYDDYVRYLYQDKGLLGLNVLKGTMNGIDGPTVTFLGKDIPLATAIMPTVGTILGTGIAAKRAHRRLGSHALNEYKGPASLQLMGETLVGAAIGGAAGTAAGAVTKELL